MREDPPSRHFARAFAANEIGLVSVGVEGTILDASATLCGWIERPRDAVIGSPLWSLVRGGTAEWWRLFRERAVADTGAPRASIDLIGPDDCHLPASGRSMWTDDPDLGRYLTLALSPDDRGWSTDQDANRAAPSRDQLTRGQLWEMLDRLPSAVALIGPDGKGLFNNVACRRLTGLGMQKVAHLETNTLPWTIYDESGQRVEWPDHDVFAPWLTGQPVFGLMLAHFPIGGSGEPVWTVSDFIPRFDTDGTLLDVLAVFTDITMSKEATKSAEQSQTLEGLARLAGGLAHDFNNILTTVLGSVEVITAILGEEHTVGEDTQRIREAAQRGAALTRQLVGYARTRDAAPRLIDLGAQIQASRPALERILGPGWTLRIDLPDSETPAIVDPSMFAHLLTTFAMRSRSVARDGGAFRIELGDDADPGLSKAPASLILRISDTGPAIPLAARPFVFDPFDRDGLGGGLALATCASIVRQHGASISVVGDPPRGVTFEISLPRASAEANS